MYTRQKTFLHENSITQIEIGWIIGRPGITPFLQNIQFLDIRA